MTKPESISGVFRKSFSPAEPWIRAGSQPFESGVADGESHNRPLGTLSHRIRTTYTYALFANSSTTETQVSFRATSNDGLRSFSQPTGQSAPAMSETTYGASGARTNTVTGADGSQTVSICSSTRTGGWCLTPTIEGRVKVQRHLPVGPGVCSPVVREAAHPPRCRRKRPTVVNSQN